MLGIRYLKAAPTTYVMHFREGRVKREGAGLSFFYYAPTSVLVAVPMASRDAPFVFNEGTLDFQTVTIQGQLTWRVAEPKRLSALLDLSVDGDARPLTDDQDNLVQRLVQHAQVLTRSVVGAMPLRKALQASEALVMEVLPRLRASELVASHGLEILDLSILSIAATPEMTRALEAEARESLQRNADEAIHARRKAGVEQERRIKESELETELSVESKRRTIRETKMAADIAVEEQRARLVDQASANSRKDADAQAYMLEATLKPLRDMDWHMMMALAARTADPRVTIAMAFRELAENAQKIGEFNISPDLLQSLTKAPGK